MTDDATQEAARLWDMSEQLRRLAATAEELSRLLRADPVAVKMTKARVKTAPKGRNGKRRGESFAAATHRILNEYDKLERELLWPVAKSQGEE